MCGLVLFVFKQQQQKGLSESKGTAKGFSNVTAKLISKNDVMVSVLVQHK